MLVTTMVNFGWSPMKYWGALVRPLTASVESGQSSPSFSTGGGVTAAVGVGAGGWTWGVIGVLTSGIGCGALEAAGLDCLSAFLVLAPTLPVITVTTTATTMPITTTATPSARPRRRQ